MDWILNNKEWLFSGIGVVAITTVGAALWAHFSARSGRGPVSSGAIGTGVVVIAAQEAPFTRLLLKILEPSAEYVGRKLRSSLQAGIDAIREERQSANLSAHIAAVIDRLTKGGIPADNSTSDLIQQLELLEEWMKGAQDTDPDEEILTRLWRELLYRIARGSMRTDRLIKRLQQLDAFDAQLLLRFAANAQYRPQADEERYHVERLVSLGLVEESSRRYVALMVYMFLAFAFIFYSVYRGVVEVPPGSTVDFLRGLMTDLLPRLAILLVTGVVASGPIFYFLPQWRVSWLGQELASYSPAAQEDTV